MCIHSAYIYIYMCAYTYIFDIYVYNIWHIYNSYAHSHTLVYYICLVPTYFTLFCLVCSHWVDRDVQEVLGRLLGSAVWRRWPVPPRRNDLLGQRLETGPDHHGCPACNGCCLHLVGAELGHRSTTDSLITQRCWFPHRFIPESARWLLGRGRMEEAKQLISRVARVNKRNSPEFLLEKVATSAAVLSQSIFSTTKYLAAVNLLLKWPNENSFYHLHKIQIFALAAVIFFLNIHKPRKSCTF